ncbi:MAG: purine nucleoside permease [Acidobacteria bacterium]|nr:purine nucleoside permease [Acidobacteriota bacterium]
MSLRILSALTIVLFANLMNAQENPWPIRAVIVTTFEIGADTGDAPGEFQLWVEREHLDQVIDFPGGVHPLRTNKDHTVLGMVSGPTLINATASMMALGLDPRFDLTHAYFLINGIAGVDPHDASIGSAVWANYVIGDVSRFIDPREMPKDWPYGIFPIGSHAPRPAEPPKHPWMRSNLYPLNEKLAAWAFAQTRNLKLQDDDKVAAFRAGFKGFPNAQRPPFVLRGDTFASNTYWHGEKMTEFANDWVALYTGGKGNFVTTQMEDSGFMGALERLQTMHRVDINRVMDLRTASNYTMQRPGHTAVESVTAPYIGTRVAVESAWLCGSTVLHKILDNWVTTRDHIPGN